MLKLAGQTEEGDASTTLVLVERNLERLRAGQPIDAVVNLELQNANGGRRLARVFLKIAYAPTHLEGVEVLVSGGDFDAGAVAKLRAWANKADREGLEVQDHQVEPFDA